MLRQSWIWLTRLLAATLLLLVVTACAVLLLGRFWLGSHLDQFRPRIEQALSQQVGIEAHIGHLAVEWHGVLPEFILREVRLQDAAGHVDLSLAWISARLATLPLLAGRIDFARLEIDHPVVRVQRRADGRMLVAGILLPTPNEEPGSPFVDWLLLQRDVRIIDGRLEWQDDLASGEVLSLPHLQWRLQRRGRHHQFELTAEAPADLVRELRVTGTLDADDSRHLEHWSGMADVRAGFLDVSRLRRYLRAPVDWRSGRGGMALTLRFDGAQVQALQADARLDAVALTLAPDLPELRFDHLAGHLAFQRLAGGFSLSARQLLAQGALSEGALQVKPADFDLRVDSQGGSARADVVNVGALAALTESLPLPPDLRSALRDRAPLGVVQGLAAEWQGSAGRIGKFKLRARLAGVSVLPVGRQPGVHNLSGVIDADQDAGRLTIDARDLVLTLPGVFVQPLQLHQLQAGAHWTRQAGNTALAIDQFRFEDPDLAGSLSGSIELRGDQPRATRLVGLLDHVELPAVPRFLPTVVGAGARSWLATALKAGSARQVRLNLAGDLDEFPFRRPGSGVFQVQVPVDGVRLEFAPGWPALTGIRALAEFDGPALTVRASEARQDRLQAHDVVARIADLEAAAPVLEVHGQLAGPLQAGLDFIQQSPLRRTLGTFAASFQAYGEGQLTLALQVPLDHADDTKVNGDLAVDSATLRDPAAAIPPVTGLHGRLHFTENIVAAEGLGAQVLGGQAQGSLRSAAGGDVLLAVHGQVEGQEVDAFYGHGQLDFVRGTGDWEGSFRFGNSNLIDISGHLPVFGAAAAFSVRQRDDGPLAIEAHGSASCARVVRNFVPVLEPAADGPLDWQVTVSHPGEGAERLGGSGQCRMFGERAEVVLGGRADALLLDIAGGLDAAALPTLVPALPTGWLAGSTRWEVHVDQRPGQPLVRIASDLRGLRIDLPPPFTKAAADGWPLRASIGRLRGASELYLNGGVEGVLGVAGLLPTAAGDRLRRLAVRIGGPALVPATDGITLSGSLARVDVAAWRAALQGGSARAAAAPGVPAESATGAGAATPADAPLPLSADLQITRMVSGRYAFDAHRWQVRSQPGGWHLQAHGPQIEGEADWSQAGSGGLKARLDRLVLDGDEPVGPDRPPAPTSPGRMLPAIDLEVRDFRFERRNLGTLQLRGEPESEGWRISQVALGVAQATLKADGHWVDRPGGSRTRLDAQLDAPDAGALLQALGYAKALRGARTQLKASLEWPGDPEDFATSHIGGTLDLDSHAGQFLTLEPGVGRLLGLLSLQALPRRVTLDFRDIFSQGFAFDSITGHFDIKQGNMRTQNLEMSGPAARVHLAGTVGLASETQDLDVQVLPSVADGLSLATTAIAGPVAGAATFLVQKLLSNPLERILTYDYHVSGSWDDPQVTRITRPTPAGTAPADGKPEPP